MNDKLTLKLVDYSQPVVGDLSLALMERGGQFESGFQSADGDGNSFTINYYESCVIQNGIKRELLQQPVAGEHHQVVLIFKQTRSDLGVGTKSVIESISKNIVKTVFAEGADYNQILLGDDNPLTKMYLVDVRVETADDKPVLYKILRLHDRI